MGTINQKEVERLEQKIKLKELNGLDTKEEDVALLKLAAEYIEQHADEEPFKSVLEGDFEVDEEWEREFDTNYCKEEGEELKKDYEQYGAEAMRESILKEFRAVSNKEEYYSFMYYTRRFVEFGPNDQELLSIIDNARFDFLEEEDYVDPAYPRMPDALGFNGSR